MPKTKGAPKVQGAVRGKRPGSAPGSPGGDQGTGGASKQTVKMLWIALGVAVIIIVVLLAQMAGVGQDPFERRVDELRAEEALRDRDQIEELTVLAREARDEVVPHLDSFSAAVPTGTETTTVDVDLAEIEGWQDGMSNAVALFDESPSGTTATNVARHSLGSSLGLLESAVDLLVIAMDAEGDLQTELVTRAGVQRDLAVQTWSIGATQLDAINIDAGLGHQHVYLDVEGVEMMSPDDFGEGDESHDH